MLNSNEGKKEHIDIGENRYLRLPVKTRVIVEGDSIPDLAVEYAGEYVEKGDIVFISEKCVACAQGRAIPMADIKPRPLAKL